MNVPTDKIDAILEVLPGIKSPTIMPLATRRMEQHSYGARPETLLGHYRKAEGHRCTRHIGSSHRKNDYLTFTLFHTTMNIIRYPSPDEWDALLKRPTLNSEDLNETVREILNRVRTEGDKAVRDCEEQFDKVRLDNLQVTPEEFDEAEKLTSIELKAAILLALNNIKTFHSAQRFETKNGNDTAME